MGNARRLLNGGAIGATALLLALLLVALPQAAWAGEASDDTESGLAAPVSSVESSDDVLIAGGDTTASDKGNAAPVGADDADASGSEIDTVVDNAVVDNDMTAVDDVDGEGSDTSGEVAADDADDTASDPAAESVQAASEVAEDDAAAATEYVNMYRLYNPNSGEHFYTSSLDEAASVTEAGWRYEGVGWVAPKSSAVPVYRLYNPNAGDHHYTQSLEERNTLISLGWNDEGIGWYSDDSGSGIEVLRQYNPNAVAGAHNFTASSEENENLVSAGWSGEGIAWYASDAATQSIQGRWIVTSAWGSLERYWLDSTATIATSRLVDPTTELDSGAGWYAYATEYGYVVRGTYDSGKGYVYVADNDGKLLGSDMESDGWVVTGAYTNGELQRYYVLVSKRAVRTSFFEVDGKQYFGQGGVGYVYRNTAVIANNKIYHANNNGVLTEFSSGDATLDGYLLEIYTKYGTNLRTLFDYVASYPYISGSKWPTGEWSISFAKEMYKNHGGNCYRYAALFCWLAKGLGYDADVVAGEVAIYGGRAAHGWTEVYIDGKTYICDSRFEREVGGGYNWFMTTYATAAATYIK